MKKTIIALSTALTVGSAMAASNTTLSTSTSSTLLDLDTYKKALENVSVSYYGALSKGNIISSGSQSESYNELTATYKINDTVSTYGRIRYGLGDGVKNDKGKNAEYRNFLNPRFGVRAFKYTNGNYSMSPELRAELPLVDSSANTYATVRLSQSSVYKINSALSVGLWTAISENISSDEAKKETKDLTSIAISPSVSYQLNDAHSFTLTYDTNTQISKKKVSNYSFDDSQSFTKDIYNNALKNNTYYLDYQNSQIKNVTLTPGLVMNAAKMNTDNIGVQLQIGISL